MGASGARAKVQSKFQELILYLAELSESDPRFGRTKLNKLLFYCDFRAFDSLGRAISGEEYQKLELGPTPIRFMPAVGDLVERKAAVWADREHFGRPQKKLIALRRPDLSQFSAAEVDLIRTVVGELWELNGREISDLAHAFPGWDAAAEREVIPYETVAVDDPRPLSEEELAQAIAAIDEHLAAQSR